MQRTISGGGGFDGGWARRRRSAKLAGRNAWVAEDWDATEMVVEVLLSTNTGKATAAVGIEPRKNARTPSVPSRLSRRLQEFNWATGDMGRWAIPVASVPLAYPRGAARPQVAAATIV